MFILDVLSWTHADMYTTVLTRTPGHEVGGCVQVCMCLYVCMCACVCGWGDSCGQQQGLKKGLLYCIYSTQYSFCITHSVGSVTKARLRCSCNEPSSDAVMCSVSSSHSGYLVVSLSDACHPPPHPPICVFRGKSVAPKGLSHVASLLSPVARLL